MHVELFVDSVRRSREEERKLRKSVTELLTLEKALHDPKMSALFLGEAVDRERRAEEFRSLAEECEQYLSRCGVTT